LKRRQENEEFALKWKKPALPKAKLPALTEVEQAEAVRINRSQSPARIEYAYPWWHSAARVAVDLRDCGWSKEAETIAGVLSGLPTGPLDGRQPEIMARQFDAIHAGAKRIKKILELLLSNDPAVGKKTPKGRGRHPKPFTKQRADFAKVHVAGKGLTWPEAAERYQKEHPEDDEHDLVSLADALRTAYNQIFKVKNRS
jgi:hypothetical protein